MKRIVTIQDISAVGKCSATVALPIISAMGVETAVIPTAVLSTHTKFEGFTFCDLTDQIAPIASHWKKLGLTFDAVYTGYLGSFEQIRLVTEFVANFRSENNLIVIDPAMADDGVLYYGFTPEFALEMAKLCGKADVIVPNLTEASYMLGIPYVGSDYDEDYIKDVLVKLTDLGAKSAVLTGVSFEEGKLGVMCYDSRTKKFAKYMNERVPQSFHGTGDVYASALVGGLVNGLGLESAMSLAVDYTLAAIKDTVAEKDHNWYGVNFERVTPFLVSELEKRKNQ